MKAKIVSLFMVIFLTSCVASAAPASPTGEGDDSGVTFVAPVPSEIPPTEPPPIDTLVPPANTSIPLFSEQYGLICGGIDEQTHLVIMSRFGMHEWIPLDHNIRVVACLFDGKWLSLTPPVGVYTQLVLLEVGGNPEIGLWSSAGFERFSNWVTLETASSDEYNFDYDALRALVARIDAGQITFDDFISGSIAHADDPD